MRITKEQREKIIILFQEGKKQIDIAKEFELSLSQINYWVNPELRLKRINKAREYFLKKNNKEKREYYKSRNEYLKAYQKRRYKEDPIYRMKQIDRVKKNKLKGGLKNDKI